MTSQTRAETLSPSPWAKVPRFLPYVTVPIAAFLPTALASMMCKYLREVCMYSFNSWWCGQIAGLRPTAGYYQDGSRWLLDVEPHLTRLGIQRQALVRIR